MGIVDVLKKLGKGDLLNLFKIEVDNSKNYDDRGANITINVSGRDKIEYTPPNTIEYQLVEKDHKKLYKNGISGYVREDLVMPQIGMMASRASKTKIFNKYKWRIEEKYYRAMITSYAIISFEDFGDFVTSNKLFDNLVKRFPSCGRRIYNFCRSGLMEGFFSNKLGELIFQGADEPVIREKFKVFFSEYVDFYPHAVWVNRIMSFNEVLTDIDIRLKLDYISWLDIYFRGNERVDIAEKLETYLEGHEGLVIDTIDRYDICKSPCVRIGIRKIKDKFTCV